MTMPGTRGKEKSDQERINQNSYQIYERFNKLRSIISPWLELLIKRGIPSP